MLTFEDLTDARRDLQRFCLMTVPSLLKLQSGISFKLLPTEGSLGKKARHTTATATCYSSIFDCPPRFRPAEFESVNDLKIKFAKKALRRKKWRSEGSADIYCRCRALPMVIDALEVFDNKIVDHIKVIFGQLKKKPERFGIGEADPSLRQKDWVQWYPPNAFHTYWTLEVLTALQRKFPDDYKRLAERDDLVLTARRAGMLLWARQQLGYQIALHSATPASSVLDSDQLAWSLAIFLRFDDALKVNLENRDFVKQAFSCLFSTQADGTWRHYKPLFHYKESGNAYCYVFETFTALLQCGLEERAESEMIRETLKPYGKNLIDLWRYADSTKIFLSSDGKEIGWCSGHRTNITSPESWATASVFSYTQALRRLIGIWSREDAYNSLNTPRSRRTAKKAAKDMVSRGKTWGINKAPVSEQLWTMFINPIRMHPCADRLEPDSQPIDDNHARSAILFGPPGTSKTTLVRSLADVIGWKYVELHASHFVSEGLTQVQKTADNLFKRLSELDHAVVLFDEIDELVRERDMEKDAFGRFLTTSMLPKLAELWDARKLLYFVATNHINYFDSAIIRSHRFDALILVSPPSFRSKINELEHLLSSEHGLKHLKFSVREQEIQKKLVAVESAMPPGDMANEATKRWLEEKLACENVMAKFALLRWDELNELAYRLANILKSRESIPRKISAPILAEALTAIADPEWRKNKSYVDYLRDTRSERRDYQMLNVWEFRGKPKKTPPGLVQSNGARWLTAVVDSPKDIEIPGFRLRFKEGGRVEVQQS